MPFAIVGNINITIQMVRVVHGIPWDATFYKVGGQKLASELLKCDKTNTWDSHLVLYPNYQFATEDWGHCDLEQAAP